MRSAGPLHRRVAAGRRRRRRVRGPVRRHVRRRRRRRRAGPDQQPAQQRRLRRVRRPARGPARPAGRASPARRPAGPEKGGDLAATARCRLAQALHGTEVTVQVADPSAGTRTVHARLPAGVRDGQKVRVRGKGARGSAGPGDLLVTVRVEPDEVFAWDGTSLKVTVPVTFAEAALGGTVAVPTLEGVARLKVPGGHPVGAHVPAQGPRPGRQGRRHRRAGHRHRRRAAEAVRRGARGRRGAARGRGRRRPARRAAGRGRAVAGAGRASA